METLWDQAKVFEHEETNNGVWVMSQSILRKKARMMFPTAWIQSIHTDLATIPSVIKNLTHRVKGDWPQGWHMQVKNIWLNRSIYVSINTNLMYVII